MNQPNFTKRLFRMGWILLFLAGCGTYQPPLTSIPTALPSAVVSIPTTAIPVSTSEIAATVLPSVVITMVSTVDSVTPETTTAFPLTGSVAIAGGGCCLGGTAGSTIQARVDFSAASSFGTVDRMRIKTHGCYSETEMESANWEPFVSSKTYPIFVPLNWTGFYISVQFQDEKGNRSPVYCDDISVDGSSPVPLVNPTEWFSQIQCISENEVRPGPGETVTGTSVNFSWPSRNTLPEGVYYKVFVYGAGDNYTGLVASAQTREASVIVQLPRERAGDIVWYITLVDANGTLIDHGQCSSFTASVLTVNPPEGIKGVHFLYQP